MHFAVNALKNWRNTRLPTLTQRCVLRTGAKRINVVGWNAWPVCIDLKSACKTQMRTKKINHRVNTWNKHMNPQMVERKHHKNTKQNRKTTFVTLWKKRSSCNCRLWSPHMKLCHKSYKTKKQKDNSIWHRWPHTSDFTANCCLSLCTTFKGAAPHCWEISSSDLRAENCSSSDGHLRLK